MEWNHSVISNCVVDKDVMKTEKEMCVSESMIDKINIISVVRERCGLKEDVVTEIVNGTLMWFGKRLNKSRSTKVDIRQMSH